MSMIQKLISGPRSLVLKINQIIEAVNAFKGMSGDGIVKVNHTPGGAMVRLDVDALAGRIAKQTNAGLVTKIFEVQSNSTVNGVYNCFEQLIDSTKWDTSNNTDYLDDRDDISIQVWNVDENKNVFAWVIATYYYKGAIVSNGGTEYRSKVVHVSEASNEPGVGGSWTDFWTVNINNHELSSGDLIIAWQVKDDSGVGRWVGTRILSIAHIIDMLKNIFEAC